MPRAILFAIIAAIVILLARLLFIRMRGAFLYDELVNQYGRRRTWFWIIILFLILSTIRMLLRRL